MSKRSTFSVSRAFYQRVSAYCAERGVPVSALCERVLNEAMETPFVAKTPRPVPAPPAQKAPTCAVCFRVGHTAAFHERPAEIEVSPELHELLDDLRIRARELHGRDVSHGELLEQGIERALEVETRR